MHHFKIINHCHSFVTIHSIVYTLMLGERLESMRHVLISQKKKQISKGIQITNGVNDCNSAIGTNDSDIQNFNRG